MQTDKLDTKQRLIEFGRKEFLEQGYAKASLRRISSAAQVTTGAIYFFFDSKEGLFRAILEETATEWKKCLREYAASEISGMKTSADNDRDMISFLFRRREEVLILFEKASGTVYENYRDELVAILESSFLESYRRHGGSQEDADIIKVIVRMRIHGYLELLHGDYTPEQALRYTGLLAIYSDCGFAAMMKQYNSMLKNPV